MKKKAILLTIIVAAALMLLSMASLADARGRKNFTGKQCVPHYHQRQGQFRASRFNVGQSDNFRGMRNLELSTEQITKIRETMLDLQKEILELRNQIQVKQLELRKLRLSSELDINQVKAKLEEISKLQIEIRMKVFEKQQKIKETLTPEQLENYRQGFQMQRLGSGISRFRSHFGRGCRGNCWYCW